MLNVGRYFILIIVRKKKDCSECCQSFHFNSSEVKQGSEHSQRFHFNGSKVWGRGGGWGHFSSGVIV